MFKRKVLAIFAAVGLVVAVGLATTGTAHAKPAQAQQQGYIYLSSNHAWCVTAAGNTVGAYFVLGKCAGAQSQLFDTFWQKCCDSSGNLEVMLQNEYSNLCITYDMPQGGPDGAYALQGSCVYAATQLFEATAVSGSWQWFDPNRQDGLGRTIAIDNSENRLVVGNHIDESYWCPSCASENWLGVNY